MHERAAETNKSKYGQDFYGRIGSKGGATPAKAPKGFAYAAANGLNWHREAGRKGGQISRKGYQAIVTEEGELFYHKKEA